MNPTETIAVKLFGWEQIPDDGPATDKCFQFNKGPKLWLRDGVFDGGSGVPHWPDLTDWNWIRRMEDALFSTIRLGEEMYGLALTQIVKEAEDPAWLALNRPPKVSWTACLHATAPQRVAACLRVLEEAGL